MICVVRKRWSSAAADPATDDLMWRMTEESFIAATGRPCYRRFDVENGRGVFHCRDRADPATDDLMWRRGMWGYRGGMCSKNIRNIRRHTMNEIIRNIEAAQLKAEVPQFNVGDTVRVYGRIKEGNRERIQVFEGIVIKKQGGSVRATFTVRKNSNGIGVEKTWPLHSPNVEKVEVIRRGKVRRAKLTYLRGRVGKKAKVKELVK